MSETLSLTATVYSKTPIGQQEIQNRALGLSPLVRRTLVLVDGKRTGAELAVFLAGQGEVDVVLNQLLALGCIEAQARTRATAAPAASEAAAARAGAEPVPGLPPAETRSAQDNEMARNFMINSVNSIIGHNTRISLVHEIFHAATTEQLRSVYHHWASSMADHSTGARRLPELREKLFKVL